MKDYPYDRKEEIIHNGMRYRLHNNYLTFGGGFFGSTIRSQSQKGLGLDFQFHIKKHHFQAGGLMSGLEFLSNNNLQAHLGYGYRKETSKYNLAFFAGPSYYITVVGVKLDSGIVAAKLYRGIGGYFCLQGVTKFLYDFGLGAEIFGDINMRQQLFGFKIIAFFSGAYRGPKKNYNPHVRSENPK